MNGSFDTMGGFYYTYQNKRNMYFWGFEFKFLKHLEHVEYHNSDLF